MSLSCSVQTVSASACLRTYANTKSRDVDHTPRPGPCRTRSRGGWAEGPRSNPSGVLGTPPRGTGHLRGKHNNLGCIYVVTEVSTRYRHRPPRVPYVRRTRRQLKETRRESNEIVYHLKVHRQAIWFRHTCREGVLLTFTSSTASLLSLS